MTGDEPGVERAKGRDVRTGVGNPWRVVQPIGGRPVLWKWWFLAGLLSLGMWAGIVALAM